MALTVHNYVHVYVATCGRNCICVPRDQTEFRVVVS
jgi:hypothetical protein